MQRRSLGGTSLSIAPLAFGGNVFGWTVDEPRAFELLDAFVDGGGNLIDTADVYPAWVPGNRGGESEAIIGKWLKRSGKRDQVVIASKVGKWAQHKGLAPVNLQLAVEDSLRRLQTDRIDLYFAHEDDASVLLADTLGGFARLIEQGKVRTIGASNYSAERFADALAVSKQHNLPRYEVLQPEYNLVSRRGYEAELEPLIRRENIGVICYYALASGFLSGKYRKAADLAGHPARSAGRAGRGGRCPSRQARAGGPGLVDGAPRHRRADRQRHQRGAIERAARRLAAFAARRRDRGAGSGQRLIRRRNHSLTRTATPAPY